MTKFSYLLRQYFNSGSFKIKLYTFDKVRLALNTYKDYIEGEKQLYAEYERWLQKWQNIDSEKLPTNAIDALTSCSNDFFPNVRTLQIIAATIPVTTATLERTFSTVKLLKSYLRTTMGQDRLTELALLYLHRSVNITEEEIIDAFARNRSRRIKFVL